MRGCGKTTVSTKVRLPNVGLQFDRRAARDHGAQARQGKKYRRGRRANATGVDVPKQPSRAGRGVVAHSRAVGAGVTPMTWLVACARCGERIGVYEPTVVLETKGIRTTSLAREPDIARLPGVIVMHAGCASEARRDRVGGD